jgi:PAS domain S-box-containing protein
VGSPSDDERFRLLVESVRDYAIYLLDPRGFVTSWNRGAERIKGYTEKEAIGAPYETFFNPEDRAAQKPQQLLATALREGRVEDFGWRLRKDGSQFWAHATITALRNEAGEHVGFAKVTHDLTDQAYRAFVEAAHAIVWTTDGAGRPNGDSPSWRAFTGQTLEEWRERGAWAPVYPEDVPALRSAWETAKSRKTPFEAEFRLRRADGLYQWMQARAIPLSNPDGTLREWFGVTFDVSERKHAQQELARALEMWTTTLRSIGDAVIATDHEGHVTFMNPVAEELTLWSAAEGQGKNLTEVFTIVNEETRARVADPVQKVLREGKIVGLANHTVLVRRDGSDLPIDDSAAPIRDAGGALVGVILVFRDVSEEKRQTAQRTFLARAGDALLSAVDYRDALSTVVHLAVPRLADWCALDVIEPGWRASQQIAVAHVDPGKVAFARDLARRYPPNPDAQNGVPNVLRTGESELYESIPQETIRAAAVDDEHRRLIDRLQLRSAIVVPLRGRERVFGALTFVYAESGRHYTRDDLVFAEELARRAAIVIERRKLEEERAVLLDRERDAREQAEIANRAKDEFLAVVSHELRTPLNAILGWTAALRRKDPPPEMDRHLAVIERNARAQGRLIEDVLDVSRIISGKLRLDVGSADVKDAIANAVESVRVTAETKKIDLVSQIDPKVGVILADHDRLRQIAANLLSNAVKFTPNGGRVEVHAARDGRVLRLAVKDSGVGIEPALLSAIFEPFKQADASTTRAHGGLGLGLAIVRQLVLAHGGTVHAESDGRGKGATFVVEIPIVELPPLKRAAVESSMPPAAAPSKLAGLKVLVVDDEVDAAELVKDLLASHGAAVQVALSATDALQTFRGFRPDVIVSDIGMPDVDGYTFIRRIRAMTAAEGGRTPAVALSAYARSEDSDRAFAAGFQTHVAKPVEPEHLVIVVANIAGLPLE